jgi:hypothetical protein
MQALLAQLEEPDAEHPDTWLTHENGWTLAIHETGLVVWDNIDLPEPPRHMVKVSREKAFELWQSLAKGDLAMIEQEPWQPGDGPSVSDEERVLRQREIEEFELVQDKLFYESLGAEGSEVPCREHGCKRGAISLSVRCRVHHFESIRHKRSPFSY